jgi:hypothetical protein
VVSTQQKAVLRDSRCSQLPRDLRLAYR